MNKKCASDPLARTITEFDLPGPKVWTLWHETPHLSWVDDHMGLENTTLRNTTASEDITAHFV
jgi:hypothetical protein